MGKYSPLHVNFVYMCSLHYGAALFLSARGVALGKHFFSVVNVSYIRIGQGRNPTIITFCVSFIFVSQGRIPRQVKGVHDLRHCPLCVSHECGAVKMLKSRRVRFMASARSVGEIVGPISLSTNLGVCSQQLRVGTGP